jgi:hypothetical protein
VTPGKLRHEYTSAALQFQTNAVTGDIAAVAVVVKRVGLGAVTNTLMERGSAGGTQEVSRPSRIKLTPGTVSQLPAKCLDSATLSRKRQTA